MTKTIKIIWPAAAPATDNFHENLKVLENQGLKILHNLSTPKERWPFATSDVDARQSEIEEALLDDSVDFILAGRGGYGSSDLIEALPWKKLELVKPKTIIGFSDISALYSALWTQLKWPAIHASMPHTEFWDTQDELIAIINDPGHRKVLDLTNISESKQVIKGVLFGGCFTVLTNLIGTPYIPGSLNGYILFWEDVGEPIAKLMRCLNQWKQSKILDGCQAIVLGRFTKLDPSGKEDSQDELETILQNEFSKRLSIPIFLSTQIGHVKENSPIKVGVPAEIKENQLIF